MECYRNNASSNYSFYRDGKYFIKKQFGVGVNDTSGAGDGCYATYISNAGKYNDPQKALHGSSRIGYSLLDHKRCFS